MYTKQVAFVICLLVLQGSALKVPDFGLISGVVDNAINTVGGLTQNVTDIASNVVNAAGSTVTDIINKGTEAIDATIQGVGNVAQNAIKNPLPCLNGLRGDITALPKQVLGDISSCVTNLVDNAVKTIKDTLALLTKMKNDFDTMSKNFNEGNMGVRATIAAQALVGIPKAVVDVANQVIDITNFVTTVQTNLATCAASKILALQTSVGNILKSAGTCLV